MWERSLLVRCDRLRGREGEGKAVSVARYRILYESNGLSPTYSVSIRSSLPLPVFDSAGFLPVGAFSVGTLERPYRADTL